MYTIRIRQKLKTGPHDAVCRASQTSDRWWELVGNVVGLESRDLSKEPWSIARRGTLKVVMKVVVETKKVREKENGLVKILRWSFRLA